MTAFFRAAKRAARAYELVELDAVQYGALLDAARAAADSDPVAAELVAGLVASRGRADAEDAVLAAWEQLRRRPVTTA